MERWEHAARALLAMQEAVTAAGTDGDRILSIVADYARRVISHADGATIELADGDELVLSAVSGISAASVGLRFKLAGSLSGFCLQTATAQICSDSELDERVDRTACRLVGLRSMIVVPVRIEGEAVGVLKVLSYKPGGFDARDLLIAELMIAPIAYGLTTASADQTRRAFEATFEQAAVGIAHVATDGRFLRVNQRFCEISGYDSDELVRGGFQQITHPDDLDADLDHVASLLRSDTASYSMEKRYVRRDGSCVWVNLTVSLVHFSDGAPDFFVAVIEDISARKSAEDFAMFDPLTGLPSRRHLLHSLDRLCEQQSRGDQPSCVAFLDLDNFKAINDRLGHLEGDRCLVEVSRALRGVTRQSDLLCRFAGDEFVVLLPNCTSTQAGRALTRMHNALTSLARAENWEIGLSIGVVTLNARATFATGRVVEAADAAMYEAKRSRSTRIVHRSLPDPKDPFQVQRPRSGIRLAQNSRRPRG